MKPKYLSVPILLAFLLTLLVACSAPAPTLPSQPSKPISPELPSLPAGEWTAFSPGGDTLCADGSPYTYYVRPGTVNKLVVDFEGGGACWSGGTCGTNGPYLPSATGAPGAAGSPQKEVGLYNHTDDRNPVKDWYHVYINYCTGDIHLGDSVQTYQTPKGEKTIYHNGQKNVTAALNWVKNNFRAPDDILVTGCSAGAYGAAIYTPQIADAYPDAKVTELGDSGAGIIPKSFVTKPDGLKRWNINAVLPPGVDLTNGIPTTFLADAYVTIGQAHPKAKLAEYNSASDGTQISFYALQRGLDPRDPTDPAVQAAGRAWAMGLGASLTKIQTGLPGSFSSYTSLLDDNDNLQDGTAHCIITRPDFYTLTTNGVLLTDWLNSLLNDPTPPAPVAPATVPTPG